MRQAIVTKYIGSRNVRGSRVKARAAAGSLTLDWDDALGAEANHTAAAVALCKRYGWHGQLVGGGLPTEDGNVYVMIDSTDPEVKIARPVQFSAQFVDRCFPDYLQDGHTRKGEWLLLTSPHGQSAKQAAQELLDFSNGEAPPDGFPEDVDDAAILRVLREACKGVDFKPVDENGNPCSNRKAAEEQPNIYVVLRWG